MVELADTPGFGNAALEEEMKNNKRLIGFLLLIPLNYILVLISVLCHDSNIDFFIKSDYSVTGWIYVLIMLVFFGSLIFLNYKIPRKAYQTGILFANLLASTIVSNRISVFLDSANPAIVVDWTTKHIYNLFLIFEIVIVLVAAFLSVFIKSVKSKNNSSDASN